MVPLASTEGMPITELPAEVLTRIAACVAAQPSGALALAETCETLRKAVGCALRDAVVVCDDKVGLRWTNLFRNDVRHATLSTPLRTDPTLRKCCPLLSSPMLETASVRGDLHSFPLLATSANLRSLSLQIRQAELHPHLLSTLSTLSKLHTLNLTYCVDFSLLQLPHAHRCACAPLRRDPDGLVRACSSIKTFSLACRCQSAQNCTLPHFPELEHATLKGFLPQDAPASLQYRAQGLKTLTLIGKHAPELAAALSPNVTGVHTVDTVQIADGSRRLTEASVALVATNCTRLQEFQALLYRGAESGLELLPPSVHTLNVGFRGLEDIRSHYGLSLPKFDGSLLTKIVQKLPALKELEISSAAISNDAVTACIRSRAVWKRLSLTIHAQEEDLDKRVIRILRTLCESCSEIDCLHFQNLPLVAIGTIDACFAQDPSRLPRLQRQVHVFTRTFPFADSRAVHNRIDDISNRVKERLRKDKQDTEEQQALSASSTDSSTPSAQSV